MLSELTAAKLDHGLAALRLAQLRGEEPSGPGEVSLATIARYCGCSADTVQRIERIALAKLAHGLRASGLPPHLAGRLVPLIDAHDQPTLL